MPPLGFPVDGGVGEGAERTDRFSVGADGPGREFCARRLVHEGHELVGEAWHGAADTDAANVGATADAGHPAALWHVAVDDRAPAAELHDALLRAVLAREVRLLVVAAPVAALVDGLRE